jgi:streptomycin 6-kinase
VPARCRRFPETALRNCTAQLTEFDGSPTRDLSSNQQGSNEAMTFKVAAQVAENCRKNPEHTAWLERLPEVVQTLGRRWSLVFGDAFDHSEISCSWVAPVTLSDGTPAVFKIGMPHMEAADEARGLQFWNGDPTVHLLASDDDSGAMLLERCEPGTPLRALPEPEQDVVIAGLLRRLWRKSFAPHSFRPLSELTKYWISCTLADQPNWSDTGLVQEGLRLFEQLPRTASTEVLLATDLHAGNVLRAEREPWLVIDPKPFVGDPAYDATQHLFNCNERLRSDPSGLIHRMADLLHIDAERIQLWTFARAAAEPRSDWNDGRLKAIARATAPY